jgi:hypothetical protein
MGRRKKDSIAVDTCQVCFIKFGSINEKGKLVKPGHGNTCKTCYMRNYNTLKKTERRCKCGKVITGIKPVCKLCYDKLDPNEGFTTRSQSYRNKKMMNRIVLTKEQYELVRRLLVKKRGRMMSYIDFFRVADIYIELFISDAFLDSCSQEEQIVLMTERLETIWQNNTNLFKTKPKRKRGRPKKVS